MGMRFDKSRAAQQELDLPDGTEGDAGREVDEKDEQGQDTHVG